MSLARGNILAKINPDGDLVTGESYHEFEVVDLTFTQTLAGLLGPERLEKAGGATEPMGEVYQLVLLRVRK
jgi:hypothetical protein